MRRTFFVFFVSFFIFATPPVTMAAGLSAGQVSAIVTLLRAFHVNEATVQDVERILMGSDPAPAAPPHAPPVGSIYPSSSMGYDISFTTVNYPSDHFGFGTVGVTRGKAFVHNPRFPTQYAWAHFASAAAPSFYLNLNAPYGTSATAVNMDTPKECAALFTTATTSAGTVSGVYFEPTECASYNYGWNTAKDARAFTKANGARDSFWWLDVEEDNSWSLNTAVNDAVIQGALDYLNSVGLKGGIYSMPYMWRDIAGSGFVPTQTVNGVPFTTPTWLPIGIATQVDAINACVTKPSFIPGSDNWVIQYVETSRSVDKNIAC